MFKLFKSPHIYHQYQDCSKFLSWSQSLDSKLPLIYEKTYCCRHRHLTYNDTGLVLSFQNEKMEDSKERLDRRSTKIQQGRAKPYSSVSASENRDGFTWAPVLPLTMHITLCLTPSPLLLFSWTLGIPTS